MTIETTFVPCLNKHPWSKRLNPWWWSFGDEGFVVPDYNNDEPYLPNSPQWYRYFNWFVIRNPLQNFVGSVIGVQEFDYWQTGPAPVEMTTWADAVPPERGWKWAILHTTTPNPIAIVSFIVYALLCWFHSLWWLIPTIFWLFPTITYLPFISYSGKIVFYLGWRPNSGGFGAKIVNGKF